MLLSDIPLIETLNNVIPDCYQMYPKKSKTLQGNLQTDSDEHQKLYYHKVGTPQSEDVLVLEFPDEPKFRISTNVSHCGR